MSGGRIWERGSGIYAASEIHYLISPYRNSNNRLLIWHHGADGETMAIEPGNSARTNAINVVHRLVDAGYSVLSCDFGGANTWGNDTAMSRITDAVTFAGTRGLRTDKIALWGESMGHMNVYNWAHRNGSKVAAVMGTIGVCDAQDAYDNAGQAVVMDAAYAGNWAGNAATRDPKQITNVVSGLHWRIYYASDDSVVPAAAAVSLASALGKSNQAVNMGTGDHSDTPLGAIDPGRIVAFINAGAW